MAPGPKCVHRAFLEQFISILNVAYHACIDPAPAYLPRLTRSLSPTPCFAPATWICLPSTWSLHTISSAGNTSSPSLLLWRRLAPPPELFLHSSPQGDHPLHSMPHSSIRFHNYNFFSFNQNNTSICNYSMLESNSPWPFSPPPMPSPRVNFFSFIH